MEPLEYVHTSAQNVISRKNLKRIEHILKKSITEGVFSNPIVDSIQT